MVGFIDLASLGWRARPGPQGRSKSGVVRAEPFFPSPHPTLVFIDSPQYPA